MSEPMRLQRALARAGIASRRHAEALIRDGRVKVNGIVAHLGQVIDPAVDAVQVDDAPIVLASDPTIWIALNKPVGVLTTSDDDRGRRTVFDLVPSHPGLTYIGRLDYMTE